MQKYPRHALSAGALVALVAVVINVGVAWAYWRYDSTTTATARAKSFQELAVSGTTVSGSRLHPGGTADLFVSIQNPNTFPVLVEAVEPGGDPSEADAKHRRAGCRTTGVSISERRHAVSWRIEGGAAETFTLPRGVKMTNRSDNACQGATFTIPLRVTGVSAP